MTYPSARSYQGTGRGGAVALLALLLALSAAGEAVAQGGSGRPEPGRAEKGGQAQSDMVIISNMPERKGPIYNLLKKLFCKNNGAVTGAANSEVWSVPQGQTSRVSKWLERLGMKVTQLREDWNHLLKRHRGPMTATQQGMVDKMKAAPGTMGVHVLEAPDAALTAFLMTNELAYRPSVPTELQTPSAKEKEQAPMRVVLPITATKTVTLERVRYTSDERGCTWHGIVAETGESALLMRWNDGHITGLVGYKGRIYTVESLGGQLHAVVEMDPRQMPPDHAAPKPTADPRADLRPDAPTKVAAVSTPPVVAPFADSQRQALEAKKIEIDLMLLYTRKSASQYVRDPKDLLAMAVEQANDAFRNSGLGNISLRLVHTQAVDYDESEGDHFEHLYRMVDGLGPFAGVRQLRNEKKADIVGLIVDDPSGCGLSTRVAPDSEEAYFVVHHSCASITISIAHEIGHILGARHDRAIDGNDMPFAYGHGHVNGKWRDIMSYRQSCDGCLRIPFWSNPRVLYQGEPTGTAAEDNARVILEQAERVSKFR
ncbi:MAG TPA: M12 family metallo-peptidase [Hyphomicrobiaceae bacterium]|nr:M12 family metallo-peptidase [Hyphomicrobiaceae bacterium]